MGPGLSLYMGRPLSGYLLGSESNGSVVVVVGNYEFCYWIYEESRPLGMHQAISLPPSKPGHPRGKQIAGTGEYMEVAGHTSSRDLHEGCGYR